MLMVVLLAPLFASVFATDSGIPTFGPKEYKFTFFLHDNLLTADPSADPVTGPAATSPVGSFFGVLVDFDDSITVSPDPASTEIGRGRGLYLFDANDNKGPGIEFVWAGVFSKLPNGYPAITNGSTLNFAGFDRTTDPKREIAIIGGTGTFRYATGYAVITTYSLVGDAAVLNITATFIAGTYPGTY
jgi:hypothetical protein